MIKKSLYLPYAFIAHSCKYFIATKTSVSGKVFQIIYLYYIKSPFEILKMSYLKFLNTLPPLNPLKDKEK